MRVDRCHQLLLLGLEVADLLGADLGGSLEVLVVLRDLTCELLDLLREGADGSSLLRDLGLEVGNIACPCSDFKAKVHRRILAPSVLLRLELGGILGLLDNRRFYLRHELKYLADGRSDARGLGNADQQQKLTDHLHCGEKIEIRLWKSF